MGIKTATASRVPVCNKTEATVLRYLLPLFLAAPATAGTLTCDSVAAYIFPRTTVYTGTTSTLDNNYTVPPTIPLGSDLYAAFFIRGPDLACTPENCTIVSATITDNRGTSYATPVFHQSYPGISSPIWVSPTSVPALSTPTVFTCTVSVQITPKDGSTLSGPNASSGITTSCNPITNGGVKLGTQVIAGRATPVLSTVDYQSPDQHDFGDILPGDSGTPLILPPPSKGSLSANVTWSGPTGASMTRTIGSTPTIIPPGVATPFDTNGKALQLDLNASSTASPGKINGNLTLTLTCP